MRLFLKEAAELDKLHRRLSISTVNLAVWGDRESVNEALRD